MRSHVSCGVSGNDVTPTHPPLNAAPAFSRIWTTGHGTYLPHDFMACGHATAVWAIAPRSAKALWKRQCPHLRRMRHLEVASHTITNYVLTNPNEHNAKPCRNGQHAKHEDTSNSAPCHLVCGSTSPSTTEHCATRCLKPWLARKLVPAVMAGLAVPLPRNLGPVFCFL